MTENRTNRWWQRPKSKWLLGIPLGAFIAFGLGAFALGGFHATLSYTDSNAFCSGCHIGMDTVVEEYQASSHFTNVHGVVAATCSDCHIPKAFVDKMVVKTKAMADVYHKITGRITLENFEQEHRERLVDKVTNDFIETDSATCRHCHDVNAMDLTAQSRSAKRKHETMEKQGKTCIDCHAGIAHKLPE